MRNQTQSKPEKRPNVTHLMSVKNGEAYLPNSLFDIATNSIAGDQIILVNDGSTDGTPDILKDFTVAEVSVEILETAGVGIINALNLGVAAARQHWIIRYDVDDRYEPNRVEKLLVARTPTAVAIFSDYDFFLNGNVYAGAIPSPITPEATEYSLIRSQQTANSSSAIRLDALRKVGGYSLDDYPTEDFGLWMRLKNVGDLISVPEVLMHHTLSSSSFSANRRSAIELKTSEIRQSVPFSPITAERRTELLETLKIYRGKNLEFTRKILLYRNVRRAAGLQGVKLNLAFRLKFLLSIFFSMNLVELTIQFYNLRKRRRFRSN